MIALAYPNGARNQCTRERYWANLAAILLNDDQAKQRASSGLAWAIFVWNTSEPNGHNWTEHTEAKILSMKLDKWNNVPWESTSDKFQSFLSPPIRRGDERKYVSSNLTMNSLKHITPEVSKLRILALNRAGLVPLRHRGAVKRFVVYSNITFI